MKCIFYDKNNNLVSIDPDNILIQFEIFENLKTSEWEISAKGASRWSTIFLSGSVVAHRQVCKLMNTAFMKKTEDWAWSWWKFWTWAWIWKWRRLWLIWWTSSEMNKIWLRDHSHNSTPVLLITFGHTSAWEKKGDDLNFLRLAAWL